MNEGLASLAYLPLFVTYRSKVFGGTTVSISSLDYANLDFIFQASGLDKLDDERCNQCSNFITIEHAEMTTFVKIEIDNTVSIAVEAAPSLTRLQDTVK